MRKVETVQAELDRALDEFSEAVRHGDDQRQEELSDLICTLEAEIDFIMA